MCRILKWDILNRQLSNYMSKLPTENLRFIIKGHRGMRWGQSAWKVVISWNWVNEPSHIGNVIAKSGCLLVPSDIRWSLLSSSSSSCSSSSDSCIAKSTNRGFRWAFSIGGYLWLCPSWLSVIILVPSFLIGKAWCDLARLKHFDWSIPRYHLLNKFQNLAQNHKKVVFCNCHSTKGLTTCMSYTLVSQKDWTSLLKFEVTRVIWFVDHWPN